MWNNFKKNRIEQINPPNIKMLELWMRSYISNDFDANLNLLEAFKNGFLDINWLCIYSRTESSNKLKINTYPLFLFALVAVIIPTESNLFRHI